jgi:hypothetical protein
MDKKQIVINVVLVAAIGYILLYKSKNAKDSSINPNEVNEVNNETTKLQEDLRIKQQAWERAVADKIAVPIYF